MKTNVDDIAKPLLPLIVLGVLKGYIKRPIGFTIGTIIALIKFKKKYRKQYPTDFISSAGFILMVYQRLQKRMSKEKAFEVTRVTVMCSSMAVMQANFRNAEDLRTFDNLVKYQKRTSKEGVTRLNSMEILEETEQGYRFKVTKCMFYEFFNDFGAPELTSIMCAVDNASFNTYLPNEVVFERGKGETIAEGAKSCSFFVKKT